MPAKAFETHPTHRILTARMHTSPTPQQLAALMPRGTVWGASMWHRCGVKGAVFGHPGGARHATRLLACTCFMDPPTGPAVYVLGRYWDMFCLRYMGVHSAQPLRFIQCAPDLRRLQQFPLFFPEATARSSLLCLPNVHCLRLLLSTISVMGGRYINLPARVPQAFSTFRSLLSLAIATHQTLIRSGRLQPLDCAIDRVV